MDLNQACAILRQQAIVSRLNFLSYPPERTSNLV